MSWVSPTGHNDPDGGWNDESDAYDGDTDTYAYSDTISVGDWSGFLELTTVEIGCDKVRYNATRSHDKVDTIDLDVYYSGGWHDVYEGTFSNNTWEEHEIGSTESVTKARMRFQNNDEYYTGRRGFIREFEFNQTYIYAPRPHATFTSPQMGMV